MIIKLLTTVLGVALFLSIWPSVDKFTKARFSSVNHTLGAR